MSHLKKIGVNISHFHFHPVRHLVCIMIIIINLFCFFAIVCDQAVINKVAELEQSLVTIEKKKKKYNSCNLNFSLLKNYRVKKCITMANIVFMAEVNG